MVAICEAVEPEERAAAKERQLANLCQADETPVKENFLNGGQTRDKVAAYVGKSGKSVVNAGF